ncbi:FecCD family ABC transporter permease [Schaalia suimastitidis]|uniref:FecCD family ABC transporter permease n=1 Tax=Schaalia suimastitidis TaxID=121163 RepID=UPI0004155289|nr:iron ABC transporter permease [Schaalia suimastitidis]
MSVTHTTHNLTAAGQAPTNSASDEDTPPTHVDSASKTTPAADGITTLQVLHQHNRRRYGALAIVAVLALVLFWLDVAAGNSWYTPGEIFAVIRGELIPGVSFAVGHLRLPRAIIAALVGIALGIAGRTSQTLLRNDLASPDIIGITSGASTAAVIAVLLFDLSGMIVNTIALASALGMVLLIFALSGRASTQGGKLILVGIGMSAVAMAMTNYVILRANIFDISEALRWLSGSLSNAAWEQVGPLSLAVGIVGVMMLLLERDLRTLRLGDEAAIGLGVNVARTRLLLLVGVVVLSAFAAAATGPIAFVAFLAGPLAVRLAGPGDSTLLGLSALIGALLVLGADLAGQHLFPTVLPVGVVTGVVGAPYLLLSLFRLNQSGASA